MNMKVTESDTLITVRTVRSVWEIQKNTQLTAKHRGGSRTLAVIEVLRLDPSQKFAWARSCSSNRTSVRPISLKSLYQHYGKLVGHPAATRQRTSKPEVLAPVDGEGEGAGASSLRLFRLEAFVLPRIEKKLDELLSLWRPKS